MTPSTLTTSRKWKKSYPYLHHRPNELMARIAVLISRRTCSLSCQLFTITWIFTSSGSVSLHCCTPHSNHITQKIPIKYLVCSSVRTTRSNIITMHDAQFNCTHCPYCTCVKNSVFSHVLNHVASDTRNMCWRV
jgi:hypothetical protein